MAILCWAAKNSLRGTVWIPQILHVGRQPLPFVKVDEQLHTPCASFHPWHVGSDGRENLSRRMWQSRAGDSGDFVYPMGVHHLDVAIRIQQGQIIHTVCDEPFTLVTLYGLPGGSHCLQPYSLADSFLTKVFFDSQSYSVCNEVRIPLTSSGTLC